MDHAVIHQNGDQLPEQAAKVRFPTRLDVRLTQWSLNQSTNDCWTYTIHSFAR